MDDDLPDPPLFRSDTGVITVAIILFAFFYPPVSVYVWLLLFKKGVISLAVFQQYDHTLPAFILHVVPPMVALAALPLRGSGQIATKILIEALYAPVAAAASLLFGIMLGCGLGIDCI